MSHEVVFINNVIHQAKVFSGATPFTHCTPTSVMAKVLLGERPDRPNHPSLTDEIWELTLQCLDENPRRRPEIMDVVRCLRRALAVRQDPTYVTNAKTSTVSANALHSLFHRFRRRLHGLPHRESTSFRTRGGMQFISRGPRDFLRRARVWLRDVGMPSAHDS